MDREILRSKLLQNKDNKAMFLLLTTLDKMSIVHLVEVNMNEDMEVDRELTNDVMRQLQDEQRQIYLGQLELGKKNIRDWKANLETYEITMKPALEQHDTEIAELQAQIVAKQEEFERHYSLELATMKSYRQYIEIATEGIKDVAKALWRLDKETKTVADGVQVRITPVFQVRDGMTEIEMIQTVSRDFGWLLTYDEKGLLKLAKEMDSEKRLERMPFIVEAEPKIAVVIKDEFWTVDSLSSQDEKLGLLTLEGNIEKCPDGLSADIQSIVDEMKEVKTDTCFVCGLTVYWSDNQWNHYTGKNVGHGVVIQDDDKSLEDCTKRIGE